jgi:hypothetical protein
VPSKDTPESYLVECYWPGVDEEKLAATLKRLRSAASALRRRGGDVTFLGSILVPADETVFALFDGFEADVRAANERAGVPFDRVLESRRMDGEQGKGEEER